MRMFDFDSCEKKTCKRGFECAINAWQIPIISCDVIVFRGMFASLCVVNNPRLCY
jgi:hypothetical protein